jgi:hypothetical protein
MDAEKEICVNQREINQRKSARKIPKNSSRRGAQIENAEGRRKKTCAIVHDFC